MKQFLMGAAVATAVLGAAGFAAFKEPAAAVAVKKTMPLKLSDLTLDRAFRITVAVGSLAVPTVIPTPATQGFVITHLSVPTSQAGFAVSVGINGGAPETIPIGPVVSGGAPLTIRDMDPPIVVRPGDIVSIGQNSNPTPTAITLGGYFVYPGEV